MPFTLLTRYLLLSATVLLGVSSSALASENCTPYESIVFDLIDEAMLFPKNKKFYEYGWAVTGPTNGWIQRYQRVSRDKEQMLKFMRKHEFVLGDVYMLVDEYRTAGELDSYFSELEQTILMASRCRR